MFQSGWRKSSFSDSSNGCVEVCAIWRKSSFSDTGNGCVEVAASDTTVHVRDTKQHGTGPVITFTGAQWQAFLGEVGDEHALPTGAGAVTVTRDRGDWLVRAGGGELRFTSAEWHAFRAGVAAGEFTLPLAPV